MTKKQFEKIIDAQKKKSAELLDLAMTCVCDTVCKYPSEGLSADEFDKRCERCTVHLEIRKAMDQAAMTGKIEAYANVSAACEDFTEEEI